MPLKECHVGSSSHAPATLPSNRSGVWTNGLNSIGDGEPGNCPKANGRDTSKLEARIKKHLTPFFTKKKMSEIAVPLINAYIAKRRADVTILPARTQGTISIPERHKPVRNATINRELAWLKQMFTLAVEAGKLLTKPKIKLLDEDNVRQGFFEREQYEAVLRHLPDDLRAVVTFAYITGWRVNSEVLTLEWRQVDFKAGQVRLEPGTTKNKEGRTFPFTKVLRALLEAQHAEAERLKKRRLFPPKEVFFRMVAEERGGEKKPRPITSFVKAFKAACRKAGWPRSHPA